MAADARGTPQPAIDGYRDIDADPARDLDNLFHCRANHRRSDSRFSNILQACAGQRTHRVENSVAEELDPEVLSNIALHRRLEAGRHQCLSERLDPWRGDAIEFAEREPVALDVPDQTGSIERCGRIDDAADDPAGLDRGRRDATRVDGLEMEPFQLATMPLEIPPGNAVLRTDHGGGWAQ